MGVWYDLLNFTRKERIGFNHLAVATASEITGSVISATLVTYYLFGCIEAVYIKNLTLANLSIFATSVEWKRDKYHSRSAIDSQFWCGRR